MILDVHRQLPWILNCWQSDRDQYFMIRDLYQSAISETQ